MKFLRVIEVVLLITWIIWLISARDAKANELYLLEPTYLSMESWKTERKIDSYYPYAQLATNDGREYWNFGAAINMNANLVRWGQYSLFTRNNVHMDSTDRQVRAIGWEWRNGLKLGRYVEVFHYHHSQHVLDDYGNGSYPLTDTYNLRLVFLER